MNKELAKTIGTTARQARQALRLTQEDAAERVNVSVEFYARIERGTSLPSILTFARIVSALGVSADALLGQQPMAMTTGVVWTAAPSTERPEIRRVLRRLRQASPGALRLVNMLLKEFEAANDTTQSSSSLESESNRTTGSREFVAADDTHLVEDEDMAIPEQTSVAHAASFESGPSARPKGARVQDTEDRTQHGWNHGIRADSDMYSRTA